jgi:hypothetical protein
VEFEILAEVGVAEVALEEKLVLAWCRRYAVALKRASQLQGCSCTEQGKAYIIVDVHDGVVPGAGHCFSTSVFLHN